MELVLSTKNFESSSNQKEDLVNKPLGFLNSEYKNVVNQSYKNQKANSVFGIKQSIKSKSYSTTCVAETTLKLSLFLTVVLLIFN